MQADKIFSLIAAASEDRGVRIADVFRMVDDLGQVSTAAFAPPDEDDAWQGSSSLGGSKHIPPEMLKLRVTRRAFYDGIMKLGLNEGINECIHAFLRPCMHFRSVCLA
jgi:hypothetical protein